MATSTSIPPKRGAQGNIKSTCQPIIFQRPGFEIDVCLNVFGQEYLVHSIILRLQSAYFRKFLDSADKVPAAKSSLFRYDYISVVDNDGEWGLEAVKSTHATNSANENTPKIKEQRLESDERLAFNTLLRAFYSRPYRFNDYKGFVDTYRLADFYCALPAFSCSLDSALYASHHFISHIEENSEQLLRIAKKLHHPLLFRECLIHQVAAVSSCDSRLSWSWRQRFDDDKDLKLAFMMGIGSVREAQALADREVFMFFMERPILIPSYLGDKWNELLGIHSNTYQTVYFYRTLLNQVIEEHYMSLPGTLKILLRNNLVLGRSEDKPLAGDRRVVIYDDAELDDGRGFLCAEIEDDYLPWDQDSVDW